VKVKDHISEEKQLLNEIKVLWSVVWGQCSSPLVSKLLDEPQMSKWKKTGGVVSLLQAIWSICMKFTVRTNPEVNLYKHLAFFYSYRHRENDSIHKYFALFKLMADGIKNFGGNLGNHDLYICRVMESKSLVTSDLSYDEFQDKFISLDKEQKKQVLEAAENKSLAIAFLMGGIPKQYEELILTLQNQYLLKNDMFPTALTDAYNLMSNFIVNSKGSSKGTSASPKDVNKSVYSLGVSFFQQTIISDHSISDDTSASYSSDNDNQISSSDYSDDSLSNTTSKTIGFCFTGIDS